MKAERKYCTFKLAGNWYGLEVHYVQTVIQGYEITQVPLAAPDVAGMINLCGDIMMAINLRKRLGLPLSDYSKKNFHLVVQVDGVCTSLIVDSVGDVVTLVDANALTPPESLNGLAQQLIIGSYHSDNGTILTIDTEKTVNVSCYKMQIVEEKNGEQSLKESLN
ncbi:MAG TPA: chemotaxis protein CheW [Myxococcales bacterium]|nr:chemotaxis protein CheW [Myxococcales bacterium]HIN86693.1 chemotaxis protein CheW [Myxococcales bacterium]